MKIRGQVVFSITERLKRMSKLVDSGCIEWQGSTYNGYGKTTIGSRIDGTRKTISAHRLSYQNSFGDIPEGMEVCHKCDNRKCINSDHLFLGTHKENMEDMRSKNRNKTLHGEMSKTAKLTNEKVIQAKEMKELGISFRGIAKLFNVDKSTIRKAIIGESWVHLNPPAGDQQ